MNGHACTAKNSQSAIARIDLKKRLDEIFFEFEIEYADECTDRFFELANAFRTKTVRPTLVEPRKERLLTGIRKCAAKLGEDLRKLNSEDLEALPKFISADLSLFLLTSDALKGAIDDIIGRRDDNTIKALTTKKFIKLCWDFGIPITWSKEIYGCRNSSAHLLGAIFAAGGMVIEGEKSSAASIANYYICKLSKGFVCDFGGVFVRVFFDRMELEPNPYISGMVRAVLDGSDAPARNLIPSGCKASEIGFKPDDFLGVFLQNASSRQSKFTTKKRQIR
jgi:hypothetical protein